MAEPVTLARPYAKAVFQSARDNDTLATWSKSLRDIALVAEDNKVREVLSSPLLTAEDQAATFTKLFGNEISDSVKSFIQILAYHGRLPLLGEVSGLFEEFRAQEEKSIEAVITTAFEVGPETLESLVEALKKNLNREVSVISAVDPSLIGGAIIRAGDTVIDSSVRGKLEKLTESINS
jgi:F-type H+-transporting ATPase subunit delta